MSVWAIVVAAGSGARFGAVKQYQTLGDRRVIDWALSSVRPVAHGVVLVVPPDRAGDDEPVDRIVPGGDTRSASVRAGLSAVPADATVVVVHDAARPLAPPELAQAVVDAVANGADGAVPGVPVTDTVKRVRNGVVVETLERRGLVAVQTPQAFSATALWRAHAAGAEATDDAALVEAGGGRVVVVPGDPANLKITAPSDLESLRQVLAARQLL